MAAEGAAVELSQPISHHMSDGGDYSDSALAAALSIRGGFRLDLGSIASSLDHESKLAVLQDGACCGALVRVTSPVPHWVGLRFVDNVCWFLDSLAEPRQMSGQQCRSFLQDHERVFAINRVVC